MDQLVPRAVVGVEPWRDAVAPRHDEVQLEESARTARRVRPLDAFEVVDLLDRHGATNALASPRPAPPSSAAVGASSP